MSQRAKRNSKPRKSDKNVDKSVNKSTIDFLPNSQSDVDELVNDCVRYFVNNASQVWFRRPEIKNSICCNNNKQFEEIIEQSRAILHNVYGFNLVQCETGATTNQAFILSNALPYKPYSDDIELEDKQNILLLLILSHIFMSKDSVSAGNMDTFLTSLKIDLDGNDPTFGNVRNYINDLVKHKFLNIETDLATKRSIYSWGPRALNEISKHEILKFVCTVFKEEQPKVWQDQYKDAQDQNFSNNLIIEDNEMVAED